MWITLCNLLSTTINNLARGKIIYEVGLDLELFQ